MSEILRLVLILVLLTIGLAAYFITAAILFPKRIQRIQAAADSTPGRCFGIGLVNVLFFAVLALVLFSLAENAGAVVRALLTIPAILISAFLAVLLSLGLAAMTNRIGGRLLPEAASWKQTLWGSVCLSFACALPVAGWFLLLPYAGFLGAGAFILTLFQREPNA